MKKMPNYEDNSTFYRGKAFERFVELTLMKIGFNLQIYQTPYEQYNIGESKAGVEIKNDQRMRETHNLYIEYYEKSRKRNKDWVPSGIFRTDNTWLWAIGDEITFYFIAKKDLIKLYYKGNFKHVEINAGTSKGYLIPVRYVELEPLQLCIFGEPFYRGENE
jgi:hypothetical protein